MEKKASLALSGRKKESIQPLFLREKEKHEG